MKFRITSKDLFYFVLFCIAFLYLCALGVLNLINFSSEGVLHGLNPFPAFSPTYLPLTLFVFFGGLYFIFTSVSSLIFDKEKGKGFKLRIGEKEESGYNRWARDKEIKEDRDVAKTAPNLEEVEVAGIPLANNGKEIWVDNGEYHSLVIGATGSGKTQTLVKPMVNLLARNGESMIITDPKGEIYRESANYLKEKGYNIVVLNFREPQRGNAWNPLALPYEYFTEGNTDKAVELIEDVALNILTTPNAPDPFWEKSASDYFSGITLGLFQDAKKSEVNLNTINYVSTIGEEKFAASNYIKEYFTLKGEASSPYTFAAGTINAPNETKGGILATFKQKIRIFSSKESLSEMLSHSDFDMRKIGREKTAVFIIIHDEKTTYHSLATIFIKQCYETLIDVAQENGGKLPFRTNFILDEFANMPPLKDVTTMVTAARSRKIRFNFIIQNYAQLKEVYGAEQAETIKGNCGNLIYLISTELAALEEISKMCGEVKSDDKDKTASTPLVTVTDLQKLKLFQAIIIRWRKPPFKTQYTPHFEIDWGIEDSIADYPTRTIRKIDIFEIKEFVKEKKRAKMLENLEKNGGSEADLNKMPAFPNFGERPQQNPDFNPMKAFGGKFDLDAMMRDIDKKIAELDAEEARQKELLAKQNENKSEVKEAIINEPKPVVEPIKINKEILKESLPIVEENTNAVISKSVSPVVEETPNFNIYNEFDSQKQNLEQPVVETTKQEEIKEEQPTLEPIKEEAPTLSNENKPKINVDADSIIVKENTVTDDEFFDDFFADDYE